VSLRRVRAERPNDSDLAMLRRAALQIAGWTAAGVAALVLLMAGAVLIVDEQQQHQQADRVSRSAWTSADDVTDPPAQTWLVVVSPTGRRQVTPGAPAAVTGLDPATLPDGIVRTVRDGRELVVFTGDRKIGRVSAAYDLTPQELEERRLQVSLASAALVGILGAAAVGALIARRAVRPLGAALALQRRFVVDASHELRTPLSVLLLRAQLLRRHLVGSVGPDRAAELDRLVDDTKVLGDVVNDLLMSVELQNRPRDGISVDLAELARDVSIGMQPLAVQRSVELSTELTGDAAAATVNGAEAALRRAIVSLVDNAISHTPPGGHVRLRVCANTSQVSVTVADDGEGLDPVQAHRLVERFSRGTAVGGGRRFGLGLALVDEIARAHGGTLTVEGEPGTGAWFTLTFPSRASGG
jgi:signal transduction histidine kinase